MKLVTTIPTEGQFIAVWQYDGLVWSSTILHNGGVLYMFLPAFGHFVPLDPDHPALTGAMHFVIS